MVVLLAPASAEPAATPTAVTVEEEAPAGPAPPLASEPAVARTASSTTIEEPPEEAPPGRNKVLTPQETKAPPVFTRYDDESWEKLLEKGKALLGDVKDNTFGYDEEAFYWLAAHVNELPPDFLKPDEECTAYSALLALPSSYRGQPVTLRGVYISVEPFHVPVLALRKDVSTLYACTVREHPLEQVRPLATVIVIDDPTPYLRVFDPVQFKGYFYKIRQYEGTQGIGSAPVLIARRLEPEEVTRADANSYGGTMANKLSIGIALGLLAVVFAGFFLARQFTSARRSAQSARPVHKFRLRRPDPISFPPGGSPTGEGGGSHA
jgi:hypothetical protein